MFQNANILLNRLKTLVDASNDSELSDLLKVKPNTVATWRNRDTLNYKTIISLCEEKGVDLNLLFFDEVKDHRTKRKKSIEELPLKKYIEECVELHIRDLKSEINNLEEKTESVFQLLDKGDVDKLLYKAKQRIARNKKDQINELNN